MKENMGFVLTFSAMMATILFLSACETPYDKDDLSLNIQAWSKDGECRLIVEGMDTDHQVAEKDTPVILEVLKDAPP